ncbi:Protein SlyX like protein [Saliniradius amylolyticus]|uniref:Protein SlyX homolog n=1 Tax=Saliniradius amylolyticus TaxID=2183582 RepID=A0A2S2DYY5_9ALTE|nr:SlyX family protein [Saliniradius amylolyticus]AWL10604.1 Protein SlyX like protein [Saliniradius amylolyticus]
MKHYTDEDIEALQTQLAFQEDTIDQLNQALASQQRQIEALEFKLGHVVDRLKQVKVSNIAREDEETPPPHY